MQVQTIRLYSFQTRRCRVISSDKAFYGYLEILNWDCEFFREFWFARRRNFDVSTYRVKCRCKHSHESHDPNLFNCTEKGCGCRAFNSDFLCAACDQHWEKHETFFETEKERREKKLPYGKNRSLFPRKYSSCRLNLSPCMARPSVQTVWRVPGNQTSPLRRKW